MPDKQTIRQTEIDRDRHTETDRDRQRQRQTDTDTDRQADIQTYRLPLSKDR